MGIPRVAIVGRPNVGKSSLLNWMAKRLISVVDPTAGVTRDRVTWIMHEQDRYFELVDTGGIGIVDSDDLSEDIEHQIQVGLDECDLLLFVVDGKTGITPLDEHVAEWIRRTSKKMLLVVNKCDSSSLDMEASTFLQLANLPLVVTSVKGNRNRNELINLILEHLPEADATEDQEGNDLLLPPELKLAIVGRRNVGKSTFINQLAETDRVIVSEVAGTTRDSIDIRFEVDGRQFVAIDTPGVRKRKSLANDIEFYGLVRAQRSIRRADVVLMFFDATQTISRVDKQLVDEIAKHYKPCVFVVNKWDLGQEENMTIDAWSEYLIKTFESMRHVPIAVLTAKDGRNIRPLINLTQSIFKQSHQRMGTGKLNRAVRMAIEKNTPPHRKNRRPRIFYATQVACAPPTIVVKCNEPKIFDGAWKRFLLGFLREVSPFQEVPIRMIYRSNTDEDRLDDLETRKVEDITDETFGDESETAADRAFPNGAEPDFADSTDAEDQVQETRADEF